VRERRREEAKFPAQAQARIYPFPLGPSLTQET
jgi:hypothetical protein